MKKFKLNGNEYEFEGLTFNSVCRLEELGVDITSANEKPMSFLRAILALAVGDANTAGDELQAHLMSGGSLDEIAKIISEEIADSDFFQAVQGKTSKLKTVK